MAHHAGARRTQHEARSLQEHAQELSQELSPARQELTLQVDYYHSRSLSAEARVVLLTRMRTGVGTVPRRTHPSLRENALLLLPPGSVSIKIGDCSGAASRLASVRRERAG